MSDQTEQNNKCKYRCKRCRTSLFSDENLYPSHQDTAECSSWYLDDSDILPWVHDLINQSGWTTGKLYCPKCQARIGGFDFVHVIQCTCEQEIIPAIWCTKGKIDHMSKLNLANYRGNDSKNEFSINNSLVSEQYSPERGSTFGHMLEASIGSSGVSHEEADANSEMGQQGCAVVADVCQCIHNVKVCSEKHCCFCHLDKNLMLPKGSKLITKEGSSFSKAKVDGHHASIHGTVQNRDASAFNSNPQDCHCSLNLLGSRAGVARITARSASTQFDPSFPCQNCRQGQSMCLARFKIQQDLQEIRDEILHLYNRVHDTDTDLCAGSKSKRKKRCKRVYRRESGRPLQSRAHFRSGGQDVNGVPSVVSKAKGSRSKSPVRDCDPISEEDQCAVCLELLVDPQTTPCDHTFCAICLRQLNRTSEGRPACPLCRAQITKVSFNRELHKKLTEKHPRTYRKREVEIRLQPQNRWALPSPTTTRFRVEDGAHDMQNGWGIRMLLQSVCVAIMITFATVLFGLFGEDRNHRAFHYFRNSALFKVFKLMLIATAVCSCVAVGVMVASIVFYAFDFVKFASLVVFSYMGIMLLVVGSVSN